MAIWARRTNATVLPTHTIMKNYKPFQNCFIPIWTVPRGSPLAHVGLTEVELLLYRYAIAIMCKFTL